MERRSESSVPSAEVFQKPSDYADVLARFGHNSPEAVAFYRANDGAGRCGLARLNDSLPGYSVSRSSIWTAPPDCRTLSGRRTPKRLLPDVVALTYARTA
jgi:hypothetical protein